MLYQNGSLIAGGDDHISIGAKVTDSLDRPVADGMNISFTVNVTPWAPEKNGSISENDTDQSLQSLTVKTKGGWANVSYGWINRSYAENNSTITAICTSDPTINNSTIVHCYYGSIIRAQVVDSFGTGYGGGATVTLHVVGKDGVHDVYNMTNTTTDLEPYLGLFILKIAVYPNSSYAYITVTAPYQKGVTATGRSSNYSGLAPGYGSPCFGPIVLRIPPPNAIKVTADPAIIVAGGDNSTITAQLMLNGSPYLRSGYVISFSSDNDSIGYLPLMRNYTTDVNGRAQIILTSNTSLGEVNVTACYPHYPVILNGGFAYYANLTDTCAVQVLAQKSSSSLPPAHITLYQNGSLIDLGDDHITIGAKVTDALDRPVADGINISFTVDENHWAPKKNGSVSENDTDQGLQSVTVKTEGGWANISYGWIDRGYSENNSTITAVCTSDPTINNSTIVHCHYGNFIQSYVVNSLGTGYGGATVTVHVIDEDGVHELYSGSNTTTELGPFTGIFLLKYVYYPNSHLYVTGMAQYQTGVTATGTSNNYSGHQSPSMGAIVLRVPPPDAIKLTAYPSLITAGGHSSTIIAQLMLNGSPYLRSNCEIDFSSDNDSIGCLPTTKNYMTDINGRAQITLTSNKSIGEVNVTACYPYCPVIINGSFAYYSNLTDTCVVPVVTYKAATFSIPHAVIPRSAWCVRSPSPP